MRVKQVFLLAATCVLASGCEFNPEIDAAGICKEHLRERLREPAGSRFENSSVRSASNHSYIVTWDVTARNGFGGMGQQTMRCVVRYTAEPDWGTSYYVD
ncbi:hypothetical protein [Maricaulis alexandrii]|uniref:hypothetical protein n=1 Tax=Maricaulis alexandrii TaxID=2570354 RepID=UPI001486C7BE|nr:hypothetical protein [Maricaulis alexandrii]